METWQIDHRGRSLVHHGDQGECTRAAEIIRSIGIKVTVEKRSRPATQSNTPRSLPRASAPSAVQSWPFPGRSDLLAAGAPVPAAGPPAPPPECRPARPFHYPQCQQVDRLLVTPSSYFACASRPGTHGHGSSVDIPSRGTGAIPNGGGCGSTPASSTSTLRESGSRGASQKRSHAAVPWAGTSVQMTTPAEAPAGSSREPAAARKASRCAENQTTVQAQAGHSVPGEIVGASQADHLNQGREPLLRRQSQHDA